MDALSLRTPVRLIGLLCLPLLAGCGVAGPRVDAADLVLRGGRVATVDSSNTIAQAVAVRGDSIVAVGSDVDIQPYIGESTRVIDLQGHLLVPGFIESHGHFMGLGTAKTELNLMKANTWDEIVDMVAQAAKDAQPGDWILGRGWHQEKWSDSPGRVVAGFPTNDRLNQVAPDNPVLLTHASGHASIANAKALEVAGVTAATKSPSGGEIVRDEAGHLTGMLVDNAERLAERAHARALAARTPAQVETDARNRVRLAAQEAVSKGVTSFQDQGESFQTIDFLRDMAENGDLPLRIYALVSPGEVTPDAEPELAKRRVIGAGDDHFTVRAIGEISADGALGSHSAWLLLPYTDQPSTSGLDVTPIPRIREIATIGMRNGFQIATHAIGDRANHEVLDAYAELLGQHPDSTNLRWRVEHAQHLEPGDIARFGKLGVIASMQGIHACSDGPYVIRRLGEKRASEGAYMWKALEADGAVVTNGTDVPVEDIDPIASYHCTVTRALADGSSFFPDQALSREAALRTYTINGAYAAFEEGEKGSIEPGKLADMAVLDRDILAAAPDSIPGTKVLYTIVGGKIVYSR